MLTPPTEPTEVVMPRCPICDSAKITIMVSAHPYAFCSSCGARWIQDGGEQRAIKRVKERTRFASAASRDQRAGSAGAPS
jgi:Zn-finger nucleic acid-binding protein